MTPPDDAKNTPSAPAHCGLLRRFRPENPAGRAGAAGARLAPGFYLFTEGIKQAFIERDTAAARASLNARRSRFDLRARMVRTGRTAALQRCSHRPAPCRTRLPHRHDRQMVPAATGAGADSQRPLPRRDPHLQPAARGRRAESRLLPRAGDALRPGGATLLAIAVLDSAEVRFGRIDALSELKRRLLVGTRQ